MLLNSTGIITFVPLAWSAEHADTCRRPSQNNYILDEGERRGANGWPIRRALDPWWAYIDAPLAENRGANSTRETQENHKRHESSMEEVWKRQAKKVPD